MRKPRNPLGSPTTPCSGKPPICNPRSSTPTTRGPMPPNEMTKMLARCATVLVPCFAIALVTALAAPASGAAANWTLRQLPPQPIGDGSSCPAVLHGISCPGDSLCVAVGAFDTVAVSRTPTAGADRWHVVHPRYDEPK